MKSELYILTLGNMEITLFSKNLTDVEKSEITEYLGKKVDSIGKFLTGFSEDEKILNVTVEKFEKHNAFDVELCLKVGGKTLIAKEVSHAYTKAIDLSKDRLAEQIKKFTEMMTKNHNEHGTIRS